MTCPSCGKQNPDGTHFCAFCGSALNAGAPPPETAFPPGPSSALPPPPAYTPPGGYAPPPPPPARPTYAPPGGYAPPPPPPAPPAYAPPGGYAPPPPPARPTYAPPPPPPAPPAYAPPGGYAPPPPSPAPPAMPGSYGAPAYAYPPRKKKTGLIAGLTAAGVAVAAFLIILFTVILPASSDEGQIKTIVKAIETALRTGEGSGLLKYMPPDLSESQKRSFANSLSGVSGMSGVRIYINDITFNKAKTKATVEVTLQASLLGISEEDNDYMYFKKVGSKWYIDQNP